MRVGLVPVLRMAAFALAYPMAAMVVGAGVLPPIVLGFVMWSVIDGREREPRRWALGAFGWGVAATVFAGVLNPTIATWLAPYVPVVPPERLMAVVVAPVVEEVLKACCVVFVLLAHPGQFDGVVDGIVYATLAGLGFEMTENLTYHLTAFAHGGLVELEHVAFVRAVVFGAGHAMITTFTGVAVGLASFARSRLQKVAFVASGLGVAITMHALHNLLVGLEVPGSPAVPVMLAVGLAWCGNGVWLLVVGWAIRAESRIVREELAAEVMRGTLCQEDAVAAGGFVARVRRNLAVYSPGSGATWGQRALLWRLDALAAELALMKHRRREFPDDGEPAAQIESYRAECRRISRHLERQRRVAGVRRRGVDMRAAEV